MPTPKDTIATLNDDVELRSVALASPLNRTMVKQDDSAYVEEMVTSSAGKQFLVAYTGDRKKPAIVTFHDLGLNYISNFQAFCNYPEMMEILQHFCIYHINAPGQEDGAAVIPEADDYPAMDDLAELVNDAINHFAVVRYIGLGVGLGANVLIRHALKYPERLDSMIVVNGQVTAPGWIEWGYQKRNVNHLRQHGVTQSVLDYLIWHHFGHNSEARAHDLINTYKHYFSSEMNAANLAKLAEQYIWRQAVDMDRDANVDQKGDTKTLKIPVLNLVGAHSPFVDETVTLNGKLNPVNTTWMKIQDASMVLEEQPGKVAEAFLLFMQGQGYCLNLRRKPVAF